ncbi:hypothetical protein SAMN05445850_7465 [Paraburkholderia tuberum]|uniref:Uncharacterized protein n=2 Tax=Paraburkholderia tuberum TaxID=157910 RepID=A0A1H1KG00_9BURK|nr:hypothetical protein SAMN05445850_7465 [Paraburkholderia tuberum]
MSESAALDPEVFLRKKAPRSKLQVHEDLIRDLIAKGFSAYMVWRYLVEVRNLKVCENTVRTFTKKLRVERASGARQQQATSKDTENSTFQTDAGGQEVATRPMVRAQLKDAAFLATDPTIDSATQDLLSRSFEQDPSPAAAANDAPVTSTFPSKDETWGSKISTPESSAIAPGPDVIKKFDPNDRRFIEEEYALRWGRRPRTKPDTQ